MLVGMQIQNLGIDYLDRRNGLIDAVDLPWPIVESESTPAEQPDVIGHSLTAVRAGAFSTSSHFGSTWD